MAHYVLTASQVAHLRAHRAHALFLLTGEVPSQAMRDHFSINLAEDDTWVIPDHTLTIVSASPCLSTLDKELSDIIPEREEGKAKELLEEAQEHWRLHGVACCLTHGTHAMPHRNCIMR